MFAPQISVHGSLVDVYGCGLLFTGKSAIGKSETALDLVERGHRLVADDVVTITRRHGDVLIGSGNQLLRHHMEIRGLGVIDVEALFGTLATLDERQIDLVVELTEWPGGADRLGLVEGAYPLLDVEVPLVCIPVRSGRSMAMLIETAARNHLLRRRGRHSALGFAERIDDEIAARQKRRAGGPP
jgi:HPr kinase/phosphorylase